MLHGENFRRYHQRGLAIVFNRDHRGFERDDRFSAAVGLNGRIFFSASRTFSSRTRNATAFSLRVSLRLSARLNWYRKNSSKISRSWAGERKKFSASRDSS